MSLKQIIARFTSFLEDSDEEITVATIEQMANSGKNNSHTSAKIIEASKCIQTGALLLTFELFLPRCILAEANTHRKHSKNTGSSRAIPIIRMLKDIMRSPFVPLYWGANKAGMQSHVQLPVWKRVLCNLLWVTHRYFTYFTVRALNALGLHKQWSNRLFEPHSYVRQVVTTSDCFSNFMALRHHGDAQPEIIYLAILMRQELIRMEKTKSWRKVNANDVKANAYNWHLPYVTELERRQYKTHPMFLAKISAARCARTSYLTQEGIVPQLEREIKTVEKLVKSDPIHASPFEHQAYPTVNGETNSRNFEGFRQYREVFETTEKGAPIYLPKVQFAD